MQNIHEKYMEIAIELAKKHSMDFEGGPFGAIIVKNDEIIAKGWNTVTSQNDPTMHSEINAIRKACKKLNTYDLSGFIMYSTTEPCPMCISAIYWARITEVYYGNTKKDAARIGFDDNAIYKAIKTNKFPFKYQGGLCENHINQLFDQWKNTPNVKLY